jgi:hypothetical protein
MLYGNFLPLKATKKADYKGRLLMGDYEVRSCGSPVLKRLPWRTEVKPGFLPHIKGV